MPRVFEGGRRVIYALLDARDMTRVRYVGCTVNPLQRYAQHRYATGYSNETAVAQWAARVPQIVMVVLEGCPAKRAHRRETFWIFYFRKALGQADLNCISRGTCESLGICYYPTHKRCGSQVIDLPAVA